MCHGVFGFAHEISCHECASTDLLASMSQAGSEHGLEHSAGHASGDGPAGGVAFVGYFGVVLALFGVAVLWLLRGAWRRDWDAFARLYRSRPSPASSRLARGPTLPLLQVFRL